jgi:uncharacterized protein involved in exopolysaccharide biosynthesis
MPNRVTLHHRSENDPNELNGDSRESTSHQYAVDIAALFRLLLGKRRLLIWSVGLAGTLTALAMVLTPNRYTSTAVILPSGKTESFSALKAMAGLSGLLGGSDNNSSALFPVILRSQLVRDSLLSKTYRFSVDSQPMSLSLVEYLGIDNPDRQRIALGNITAVSSDTRTGEISVSVETKFPEFSQALVAEYLRQLEIFNLYSRKSEATERVRYLTRELEVRETALRTAEDSLEWFQSRNRNWIGASSPTLLKELNRLKRDTEAKAQTYAYLLQEYEVARLDAQKDMPVVRILDQASLPTLKSGPQRTITVLAVSGVTFILVVFGIFAADILRQIGTRNRSGNANELTDMIAGSFPRTVRTYRRVTSRLQRQPI